MTDKLYLFDFDGTVCDTRDAIAFSLLQTFRAFDVSVPTDARITEAVGSGLRLADTIQTLQPERAETLGDEAIAEWMSCYRQIYREAGAIHEKLYPDIVVLFDELAKRSVHSVVLSNKGQDAVVDSISRHGISELISVVIGDRPGVPKKPDPTAFNDLIAPDFPSIRRADTVMIGDTDVDILFAKNAGIHSCWVEYGYGNKAQCLQHIPDFPASSPLDILEL